MEDQRRRRSPDPNSQGSSSSEKNEPVRSRWTPKPEQILILESIFNSGMVNPPKDETVKIRKLLEKFGSVGDANVFYWFQNRRSRSRRRQRQIQASLIAGGGGDHHPHHQLNNNTSSYNCSTQALAQALSTGFATSSSSSSSCFGGLSSATSVSSSSSSSCDIVVGGSSNITNIGGDHGGGGIIHDNLFSTSTHQMGRLLDDIDHNSSSGNSIYLCPSDPSNLHFQSGFITVFINGVQTEVPRGPLDMKAMFGEELVLIHSSGLQVPFNDYGFNSLQSLQHGESYFLVSRST